MSKQFQHLNAEWKAEMTGTGHGVGSGAPPPITSWGVMFECVSHPAWGSYIGSLSRSSVVDASEDELRRSLDAAIDAARDRVMKALDDPRWDWRTAEGIASQTGLAERQVKYLLESMPDLVIRSQSPDTQGRALYKTRQRWSKSASFFERVRST